MIEIQLNHEPVELPEAVPIDRALAQWDYDPDHVAVAVNETFVPREVWAEQRLHDGDRVDVLGRIVGG